MTTVTLYTGGGVSRSPQNADGRRVSDYVRLVADDGRGITDGTAVVTCIDVKKADAANWADCDAPTEQLSDLSTEDALSIITGGIV